MRTRLSVLAAVVALAFAGTAKADTISIFWSGGGGGSTTTAAASGTVTASVVMTITSTNISSYLFAVEYDATELSVLGVSCSAYSVLAGQTPGVSQCQGGATADLGGSPIGTVRPWDDARQIAAPNTFTPGTFTLGTIRFHVDAGVASDGNVDVQAVFQPGDNCYTSGYGYCTGNWQLSGASVNPVPEPGTVALLSLGLVGLGIMGRRSRD